MAALNHRSFGDRGQRIGLRLITKVGSLPVLGNPDVRRTVESLLYRGSKGAFGGPRGSLQAALPIAGRPWGPGPHSSGPASTRVRPDPLGGPGA